MTLELAGRHGLAGRLIGMLLAGSAGVPLAACGETYIDTSVTTASPSVATSVASVDPNAPVADLLSEMSTLMLGLDFAISDGPDARAVMARIEELWNAAEPTVRSTALDSTADFEQAMELARNGVDRNRPADASKAYKILAAVSAAYLTPEPSGRS